MLTVYHGSKNGLDGPIRMKVGRNRQTCDFGQGFYMGDEPTQPRTLICDGENPVLYTLSLDLEGLRVHRFKTDADWAKSERQRRRAAAAADEICVSMRREGEGFADLVRSRFGRGAGR